MNPQVTYQTGEDHNGHWWAVWQGGRLVAFGAGIKLWRSANAARKRWSKRATSQQLPTLECTHLGIMMAAYKFKQEASEKMNEQGNTVCPKCKGTNVEQTTIGQFEAVDNTSTAHCDCGYKGTVACFTPGTQEHEAAQADEDQGTCETCARCFVSGFNGERRNCYKLWVDASGQAFVKAPEEEAPKGSHPLVVPPGFGCNLHESKMEGATE